MKKKYICITKQNNDFIFKSLCINNKTEIKKIFLIFITSLLSLSARSQVFEYNLSARINSIVRTVDDTCILTYTQESSSVSYFVFRNNSTNTTLAFQCPAWMTVRDFRVIDGRTAYFCGTTGSLAIIGMFHIRQVFHSGGAYYIYIVLGSFGDFTYLNDLNRLKLFNYGGTTVMAMVGQGQFIPLSNQPKSVLVSAYFDGTNWNISCDGRKPDEYRYTDIACLDSIIVAVGTDTNDAGCYIKTYHRTLNFLANACTPSYGYQILYGNPVGKVLITDYSENEAVVTHYDLSGASVLHRVPFLSTGSMYTSTVNTWITTPPSSYSYSSNWDMLELATTTDGFTYSLQYTDYPVYSGGSPKYWLVRNNYNTAPVSTIAAATNDYTNQSMDIARDGLRPRISCGIPNLLTYEPIANILNPRCMSPFSLNVNCVPAYIFKPYIYDGVKSQVQSTTAIVTPIIHVGTNMICN